MDQRRFLTFLLLSMTLLFLWSRLFDQRAQPPQQPPPPAAAGNKDQPDPNGQAAEAPAAAGALPQIAANAGLTEFLSLGSLDPTSGYRMLVTLTSKGAAVQRAEMSSPRYADQHDRAGYLGELELMKVEGGLRVQAAGEGTPARLAGIEIGDVIVGLGDDQPADIASADDLDAALAKTKPGDQITLHVRRGDGQPQSRVATLIRRPFAVLRPEIENFQMRGDEPPADFVDPPSFLVTLSELNGKALEEREAKSLAEALERGNWEVADRDANSVTFRRTLPELKLELLKRYTLKPAPLAHEDDITPPGYHLQLDIELKNTGEERQELAYRLDGPTGMPTEGWWYNPHKISRSRCLGGAGMRDVSLRFAPGGPVQDDCSSIVDGDVKPHQGAPLAYVGVDGQYFSAALIPMKALDETLFDTTEAIVVGPKPPKRFPPNWTNVTSRLTSTVAQLNPGATRRDSFQVFIGPKRPALLAEYQAGGNPDYSLIDLIYYGWFGYVARAMLAILHFFYGIVGNYGIAIIMLTVLVRGALFPLSYRATKSMSRLQALKPEMDRITEKYKSDVQARSRAIQELYRKHEINPLGGCLPMLLQLPILMGLYRALMIDVELRMSPLFGPSIRWCSNLAAPDMLFDWSGFMPDFVNNGSGMFALGPYFNVLPLITVGLFLVTQKMTMPPPTNEQAALQQKIMKYMTIFIGFMFYKVASGLCIYFIASSLWGIAERRLLKRAKDQDAFLSGIASTASNGPTKPPRDRPGKSGRNGSAGEKKRPKSRRK